MGDKRNNDIKKSTTEGANQNNQDNYTMTDTEAQVLNKLSSEPVSRSELSNWIGIDDRAVRKAIERLRLQGYPIREYRSKAFKMLKTARSMEHGKKYI